MDAKPYTNDCFTSYAGTQADVKRQTRAQSFLNITTFQTIPTTLHIYSNLPSTSRHITASEVQRCQTSQFAEIYKTDKMVLVTVFKIVRD